MQTIALGDVTASAPVAVVDPDGANLNTNHDGGTDATNDGGSSAAEESPAPRTPERLNLQVIRPRRTVMEGWLKKFPSLGNIGLAHRRWFVLKEVPSMVTFAWWAGQRQTDKKGMLSLTEGAVRHIKDIITGKMTTTFEVKGEDIMGTADVRGGELRIFVAEADTPDQAAEWVDAITNSVRQLRQGRGLPSPRRQEEEGHKKSPESLAEGLKSVTDALKSIKIDWGDGDKADAKSKPPPFVVVTVPVGVQSGEQILVNPVTPGCSQFLATVPPGVTEGMKFKVQEPLMSSSRKGKKAKKMSKAEVGLKYSFLAFAATFMPRLSNADMSSLYSGRDARSVSVARQCLSKPG